MLKINAPAKIGKATQTSLDSIPVKERGKAWNGKKNANSTKFAKEIGIFKAKIMLHGMKAQGKRCVWCTLPVGEDGRRRADRDHIAPKKRHPKWTFHSKNLAISCEYCNGFSVKKDIDTIEVDNANYDLITFKVVHPYIDDPKIHLDFVEKAIKGKPGIAIKGLSPRGRWTIKNLKLNSPGLTAERAKELLYMRSWNALPLKFQVLLDKATGRA